LVEQKKKSYERVWIISDIHFGLHAVSLKWLEETERYFDNFLIPLIKENKQENDCLFILGDVFDNRININSIVLNKVLKIFKKLSKMLPIEILVGNHDTAYKTSNDINSLNIFNYLPNINVYSEPVCLNCSQKKLLMIPWRSSDEDFLSAISDVPGADYLFAHHDFQGLRYNSNIYVEEGVDVSKIESVDSIKQIYSGHIHLRQEYKNVKMVGNPFHQTRNDIGNEKGVYLLDLKTDQDEFHYNHFSPCFLRLNFVDLVEMKRKDAERLISNSILDLVIPKKIQNHYAWSKLTDLLKLTNETRYIITEDDVNSNYEMSKGLTQFKLDDELNIYLNALEQPAEVKQLMKVKIKELYDSAISQ